MNLANKKNADDASEWRINDDPVQLREWGTETIHPLPRSQGERMIGAADGCWLTLVDQTRRISGQHAKLARGDDGWTLRDLQSENGIRVDGAVRRECVLVPGVEVGIGRITLIPESPRWCALRDVVGRIVGWSADRRSEVDRAMRAIRVAATRRESLLLCGDGDLVSIARLLHRHALGDDRPFIVCDPRRLSNDGNGRHAANVRDGFEALAAAAGGTLCVWHRRLPTRFAEVATAARSPDSRVQLVVCAPTLLHGEPLISSPIILPPLLRRRDELPRIIDAYVADAVAELDGEFLPADREWIQIHEAGTLSQIEQATRRLLALRNARGRISPAANQLGLTHGALSEWLARRMGLPDPDSTRGRKPSRRSVRFVVRCSDN
jgi:hypothetical protein